MATIFSCSRCHKNLKAGTALAGKKVKCPRCSEVNLVPPASADMPTAEFATEIVAAGPGRPWLGLVLGVILLAAFLLNLRHLDHTALTRWDEVYHALVAQNLVKHPLKPTLVDVPYLPYVKTKWGENHVWLHKPTLPLWQIALSFAILGIDTFALRLPSAILSIGAAWVTYLIGKEILDRRAAFLAAALQALNPFLVRLVQGYQFADHIDIALLFWVEVGMYFLLRALRTGLWRDLVLAGVAQGLAFLCKSYLAGIIFGIALTAWLLPYCSLGRRADCRMSPRRLLALLGVSVMVVAPWQVYCLVNYADEFWHEHAQIWLHLSSNIENWQAPWDRLVFDYMIGIHGVFYGPAILAGAVLIGKAVAQQHAGTWLLYAWALGVLCPHLFAVTKTPSATLLALPPLLLLLGSLASEAWRGDGASLAALVGVLAMSLLFPAVVKNPGHGYPNPRVFGAIMMQSLWVVGQVMGALILTALYCLIINRRPLHRYVYRAAFIFALAMFLWLGSEHVRAAWRLTETNAADPICLHVGDFARRQLPDNAVLLCEERRGDEHLATMFYADRTCYPLSTNSMDVTARLILQAGGIPYIVTRQNMPFAVVHVSPGFGPTIYRWEPK